MQRVGRITTISMALLALAPAAASAAATVTRGGTVVTYQGDAANEAVTVAGSPSAVTFFSTQNITTASPGCSGSGSPTVTCIQTPPFGSPGHIPGAEFPLIQVNVNLGGGQDTLTAPGELTVPLLFANGEAGLDTFDLSGRPAFNNVNGGPDADTVTYQSRNTPVVVRLGAGGAATNANGAGSDVIAAVENARGGNGADQLFGNELANTLTGGPGDDLFVGGAGADTLDGGTGSNTVSFEERNTPVNIVLGVVDPINGEDTLTNPAQFQNARGGDGNDTITGFAAANTLEGKAGDDTINGLGGEDYLGGGPGVDTINGGAGFDEIYGDEDGDVISGGDDDDLLYGGAGDDTISGDAGPDTLIGEEGNDTLNGGTGADQLAGGSGTDLLIGGADTDVLVGGDDVDIASWEGHTDPVTVTLDGVINDGAAGENDNIAADIEGLRGGSGNDTLFGSPGANQIEGGDGDDTLDGGDGADVVDGGNGNDKVIGSSGIDTLFGGAGDDTMTAFDGLDEDVDCGPGNDGGTADIGERLVACENVSRVGVTPPDLDLDDDGVNTPADCDDSNAAIKPGAVDIPGNGIDEDCSGADAAFPRIGSGVRNSWDARTKFTVVKRLEVLDAPAGSTVRVTCKPKRKKDRKSCAFRSKSVKTGSSARTVKLTKLFKKRKLKVGTKLQIRITAPQSIGKVVSYTIAKKRIPRGIVRCLPVGSSKPQRSC